MVLTLPMMAKSQAGSSRPSAPAGRSAAGGKAPSSKAPSSKAPPAKPPSAKPPSALGAFYRAHRGEIWGLVAIVGALLTALGIYGGLGGFVGTACRRVSGLAIGWGRLAVPPALAALGVMLISGRYRKGEEGEGRPSVQITGGALLMVSVAGILHFATGRPAWGDALADFENAGGYVGYAFGAVLQRLAGTAGAVVLLAAIGLLGWLAVSGMPLSRVARGSWRVLRRTGLALAALVRLVVTDRRPVTEEMAPVPAGPVGDPVGDGTLGAAPVRGLVPPMAAPAAAPLSAGPVSEALNGAHEAPDAAPGRSRGRTSPKQDTAPPLGEELALPAPGADVGNWRRPVLGLLKRTPPQEVDRGLIDERGRALEAALAAHGVEAVLAGVVVGPTVSRYELVLGEGVKVARLTSLARDIAYALASPDVRILAPIPGRQAIGVEVPNPQRQVVTLGDILSSPEAAGADHPLDVAIGRDITGQAVMANLGQMPHILIAGATGAGKSSCINSVITSILMRCTPEQVRLILVDPKMVEMRQFANVPHLLTQPVIDPKKAANALGWAVREMERRYELLSRIGCRDIAGYNEMYEASLNAGAAGSGPGADDDDEPLQRLPFIVIVVDELSDLMMVAPREVEDAIWRLAQMARAVGVHLVIATQRPSTNVITGVIKANIPARLALSVSSLTDSRVILDQAGAERLVGHGDMLLLDGTAGTPRRIQGAWVSEDEIRRVTAVWRRQNVRPDPSAEGITEQDLNTTRPVTPGNPGDPDDDELLRAAMELVVDSQLGSTSMLQRKLRVGFARAGRLMDLLEQRGVVGPSEGSKAREVLMTPQEFAVEQAAAAAGRPAIDL